MKYLVFLFIFNVFADHKMPLDNGDQNPLGTYHLEVNIAGVMYDDILTITDMVHDYSHAHTLYQCLYLSGSFEVPNVFTAPVSGKYQIDSYSHHLSPLTDDLKVLLPGKKPFSNLQLHFIAEENGTSFPVELSAIVSSFNEFYGELKTEGKVLGKFKAVKKQIPSLLESEL